VRDTNWRGRLIGYLINVERHVAIARLDAFDERNRIVAAVNDLFAMDRHKLEKGTT
jgi:hypothetical protein